MRIYLHTTPNTEPVPYNYQPALVGALHKWMGRNEHHDSLSLYSLSWLSPGRARTGGLHWQEGASFSFSTPDPELIKCLIDGIQGDETIAWGMSVAEIVLRPTPEFGNTHTFLLESPVLIKRNTSERENRFFYPQDEEADDLLTETLKHKLSKAGMGELPVTVGFDHSYSNIRTKGATYKGIHNKGTLCPVIVQGDPRAVAFAWEVGVGNCTGIGFGAVK